MREFSRSNRRRRFIKNQHMGAFPIISSYLILFVVYHDIKYPVNFHEIWVEYLDIC